MFEKPIENQYGPQCVAIDDFNNDTRLYTSLSSIEIAMMGVSSQNIWAKL